VIPVRTLTVGATEAGARGMLAFLYPGPGTERVGMGARARREARARPVFELMSDVTGADIARLCDTGPPERLARSELAPAAVFATAVAAHLALDGRGVRPAGGSVASSGWWGQAWTGSWSAAAVARSTASTGRSPPRADGGGVRSRRGGGAGRARPPAPLATAPAQGGGGMWTTRARWTPSVSYQVLVSVPVRPSAVNLRSRSRPWPSATAARTTVRTSRWKRSGCALR
jgi:hypothetical protein